MKENKEKGRIVILFVEDGVKEENNQLLNQSELAYDGFNRPKLGGVSSYLRDEIKRHTGNEAKVMMPGIWQRSSMKHAAKEDVDEEYKLGAAAWHTEKKGA